ncbi:uncharacterized protein VP01_2769g6 [Puccinia sorghi]|uniref:Uncharacterized protein n=1 Tax=Puccinia sorghi TaxID=27349 RepID=A0A0L6V2X1_9BASI|nr:uncharacterized protein VP01_2769g6 [Puccinia sorghi]
MQHAPATLPSQLNIWCSSSVVANFYHLGPTGSSGYFQYFIPHTSKTLVENMSKHTLWLMKREQSGFSRRQVEYLGILTSCNHQQMDPAFIYTLILKITDPYRPFILECDFSLNLRQEQLWGLYRQENSCRSQQYLPLRAWYTPEAAAGQRDACSALKHSVVIPKDQHSQKDINMGQKQEYYFRFRISAQNNPRSLP